MFKILIDTCVWLDLAKDHRQEALLTSLEALVHEGEVSLIVPRIVLDEFSKNKKKIAEESSRGLSSSLKRAREILHKLGEGKGKRLALEHLAEIDYKLPRLGETAIESIRRIEKLLNSAEILETSESIMLRAAQRAIDHRAPFHRQRNGINDAMLIEIYSDITHDKTSSGVRFAFITHNTKDFSHPTDDGRIPHPDIAGLFSRVKSLYMTGLAQTLQRVAPQLVTDTMLESEWSEEPRSLTEILDLIGELSDKIWYDRHQLLLEKINSGKIKVVEKETFPIVDHQRRPIQRDVFEGAMRSARKVEKKYGIDNLGPWSKFEWGMMNGKLSALRWVLGEDWETTLDI
jgi:PIN domain